MVVRVRRGGACAANGVACGVRRGCKDCGGGDGGRVPGGVEFCSRIGEGTGRVGYVGWVLGRGTNDWGRVADRGGGTCEWRGQPVCVCECMCVCECENMRM